MNDDHSVFLVIDVQIDFLPGGPLAVADGDAVIAPINRLLQRFHDAIGTQDWHPPDHFSLPRTIRAMNRIRS
jgi:nicotinamidase/pyrazinamidase